MTTSTLTCACSYSELYTFTVLSSAEQCLFPGEPLHIGDPPGEGVITFGVVLPFSYLTPNGLCGDFNPVALTTVEAVAWAINNARTIYAETGGPKIGMCAIVSRRSSISNL